MTHFVTLHYLALYAPWLALLFGAVTGPRVGPMVGPHPDPLPLASVRVWRWARERDSQGLALVGAVGLAAWGMTRLPEELFSRQLACDWVALATVIVTALVAPRYTVTRRARLAVMALALVAAGNDILSLALAATLASVCLARRATAAWALLGAAMAFAIVGETELAIVASHPVALAVVALGVWLTLPRTLLSLPAAIALLVRIGGLLWVAPGARWLLQ